jgi:hypothetical protein
MSLPPELSDPAAKSAPEDIVRGIRDIAAQLFPRLAASFSGDGK